MTLETSTPDDVAAQETSTATASPAAKKPRGLHKTRALVAKTLGEGPIEPQTQAPSAGQDLSGPFAWPVMEIKLMLEAILFAAPESLSLREIRDCLGVTLAERDIRMILRELERDYENRAFQLFECNNRYQLRTRPQYADIVRKQFASRPRAFSKAALETLSIIAYRESQGKPATRAEINSIRMVDSTSIVDTLVSKGLVSVHGKRAEASGAPLTYKTTPKFLEAFSIQSLKELPSLRAVQPTAESRKDMAEALESLDESKTPPPQAVDLAFLDENEDTPEA